MMNEMWIRKTLIASVALLVAGLLAMFLGAKEMERLTSTEPSLLLIAVGTIGMNGFLLVSIILWLNELVFQWKEKSDSGARIEALAWLLITNIFGAYYFSILRAKR